MVALRLWVDFCSPCDSDVISQYFTNVRRIWDRHTDRRTETRPILYTFRYERGQGNNNISIVWPRHLTL